MLDRIEPEIDFSQALRGLHDLSGKVVFAAGGYGGIGEAITWALAMAGARVVIAGRNGEKAAQLAAAVSNKGHLSGHQTLDCASVDSIVQSVDAAAARHGRLDILVNCVGVQREESLLDVSEEAFDEVYRINLKAAMFLAQAAARHQIAAGRGGKQIHLLSVRSQLALRNRGYSAYCATKGGLVMLVKQHAMELAPKSITVNAIAPTFVYTEMIRHVMENDGFRAALLDRIPLGRIADPKDIAGPALFLASPASDFVTGQTLYVDGGITASQ